MKSKKVLLVFNKKRGDIMKKDEVTVTRINKFMLECDGIEIWAVVDNERLTLSNHLDKDIFTFPDSDPMIVKAIGKMFIKAAEMARKGGE